MGAPHSADERRQPERAPSAFGGPDSFPRVVSVCGEPKHPAFDDNRLCVRCADGTLVVFEAESEER